MIVDAQLRWLRAARAAGVRRFLPSDYSLDFFRLADGENVNSDARRAFAAAAEAERGDVRAWLPLMYWGPMLSGRAKLDPLMNDRYPAVRPTGVREYAEQMAAELPQGSVSQA